MNPSDGISRLGSSARRALGLLLIGAAYLPLHRLLDPDRAGPAAASARDVGEAIWGLTLWGTILVGVVALLLARGAASVPLRERLRAVADRLIGATPVTVAVLVGACALLLSALAALTLFGRLPTLADAMAQLLQARAWAAGALAAPPTDPAAARAVQNGLTTAEGWVSVYPPGHTALLALGVRAGAPWLVGPVLTALTAALTVLVARRLLPDRPRTALVGGALVALSPFIVLLGGGYLSHTSAAAGTALALYCALRARDGAAAWAVAAGAATGAIVLSRPWTGLVLGGTLCAGLWLAEARARRGERAWLGRRLALWVLGGVPPALALAAYDARFFGAPLRLGYEVAFGPAHGLGLHRDPWGNAYGAREALAYTGFDLMTLGAQLLETPVSVVGVVGLWLLVARTLPRGAGVLLAWAVAPVLANALYWHHGYHLGPRMLYEAAPAWCVLGALAVVELTRPRSWAGRAVLWLAVLAVPAGLALQLPPRIASARWSQDARARSRPPIVTGAGTAVVFVHGSWPGRVAARLAAAGMRRDSIETALRRNGLCRVSQLAGMRDGRSVQGADDGLDFTPEPGSPARLRTLELAPGTYARIDPSAPVAPECVREARADRLGTLELEPLAWQTPIPELEDGAPLLFRDLGPGDNERVLARHPGATAWLLLPPSTDGGGLLPYREGMEMLWGDGR